MAAQIGGGIGGALGLGIGTAITGQPGKEPSGTQIRHLTGGITSGGLRTDFIGSPKNRNITVKSTKQRDALVNNIADLFGLQSTELGQLRNQLAPGFGAITKARRRQIESAARRSTGQLTENLARRRVLGSSFGSDTLVRAGNDFGQALADADAQSFLEELEANLQLLNAQKAAGRAKFETLLGEMNVQADLAMSLLQGSQSSVASASNLAASIRAQFDNAILQTSVAAGSEIGAGTGQALEDYFSWGASSATKNLGGAGSAAGSKSFSNMGRGLSVGQQ